jgi:hypothetical protein
MSAEEPVRTLDDLVLDRDTVERVKAWLDRPRGILVLWHPLGCGVSTMLRAMERQVSDRVAFLWELPEVVGSTRTVLGQRKVLVLDGIDHHFGTDPNATKKFLQCLETRAVPIILAGGHRRVTKAKVTRALASDDTVIQVPPLSDEAVVKALGPLTRDPLALFERCSRDFRHAYACASGGIDDERAIKDMLPDGLPALEYLLRHANAAHMPDMPFGHVCRIVCGDINMLTDGLFENYVHAVDDPEASNVILDLLQHCDTMHARVYTDPSSEYPEMAACLAGVRTCVSTRARRRHRDIKTFGSTWANTNHMFAKRHHLRALSLAGAGRSCPRPLLDLHMMRRMLLSDLPSQAPRMHALLDRSDTALWHLFSQVWKSGRQGPSYTKAALVDAARPSSRRGTKRPSSMARNCT